MILSSSAQPANTAFLTGKRPDQEAPILGAPQRRSLAPCRPLLLTVAWTHEDRVWDPPQYGCCRLPQGQEISHRADAHEYSLVIDSRAMMETVVPP